MRKESGETAGKITFEDALREIEEENSDLEPDPKRDRIQARALLIQVRRQRRQAGLAMRSESPVSKYGNERPWRMAGTSSQQGPKSNSLGHYAFGQHHSVVRTGDQAYRGRFPGNNHRPGRIDNDYGGSHR